MKGALPVGRAEYSICLDVTRLLSRVGRGALTGVDRVEYAYLSWCLRHHPDARYICRTTRGYLLFGHDGGSCLAGILDGRAPLGPADRLSRLYGKGGSLRHRAEAMLRPHAQARCLARRIARMLTSEFRDRTVYLNVGHSNLSIRMLAAGSAHPELRMAVLVHDVIPLDHPDFVVPGQPQRFEAMMMRVCKQADLIIANSHDTRTRLTSHAAGWGRLPNVAVAHLGLPDPVAFGPLPPGFDTGHPSFLALGTIEPRKNHTLLLDVWDDLAETLPANRVPHLHLVGNRGWRSEDLFARLDDHPLNGTCIFEHGALPDTQVRSMMAAASGLLFPSLAEGFGLPPTEALREGCVPICSDLPVLREVLGDSVIYLDPLDAYSWSATIKQQIVDSFSVPETAKARLPDWQAHFTTVEAALHALWQDRQEGRL
ncbi:glycosyltransferase family 4 protein [Rhodophyticola porphyridii]|uniref:Glycosyltransferase family 1 protein n=1 Tax=Rhodophyticola porphyridii TaxID=1852017 RepID=A0A3L9Y1X1_9RHOB|nr:glycosyltransferase family 1 protein [Rhodophyticola porphyridii]RMA42829.1 glycosyltransferase family 1 protein [Rhodophyticola porphyridii]